MEYCIEHKRELNEEEKKILRHLLSQPEHDLYFNQIESLCVIARCGCGRCPTIMLGESYKDEPKPSGHNLVQYYGTNSEGEVVGVTVMVASGKITELEASSFSGGDINSWPPTMNLVPVNA